jgi:hypothetical protein
MILSKSTLKATSMSTLIQFAYPHPASTTTTPARKASILSFPHQCELNDRLSIPSRGIVLGTVLSTFLWAALILAAHAVWLLLR